MKRRDVGGQAVIEGVMMRGSKSLATAVRTPKGNIEINYKDNTPITKKKPIFNIPFIGAIGFIFAGILSVILIYNIISKK